MGEIHNGSGVPLDHFPDCKARSTIIRDGLGALEPAVVLDGGVNRIAPFVRYLVQDLVSTRTVGMGEDGAISPAHGIAFEIADASSLSNDVGAFIDWPNESRPTLFCLAF